MKESINYKTLITVMFVGFIPLLPTVLQSGTDVEFQTRCENAWNASALANQGCYAHAIRYHYISQGVIISYAATFVFAQVIFRT